MTKLNIIKIQERPVLYEFHFTYQEKDIDFLLLNEVLVFTLDEVAELIQRSSSTLRTVLINRTIPEVERYIIEQLHLRAKGIKSNAKCYQLNETTMICAQEIVNATGVTFACACRRLIKYDEGIIDQKELFFAPAYARRGWTKPGPTLNTINQKPMQRPEILNNMQPRKKVASLGKAGTWEREHCHSEKFTDAASKSFVCGTSSAGQVLRGD